MHGATFVVDAAFIADTLDNNGIVIDIGRAHDALKAVLTPLNYRNLDDVPEFKGSNTTTEFLSKHIFDGLANAGPRRRTRPSRPGAQGPAHHALRVARRPRAIRGALVVKHVVFAVPGSLDTPTGGYAYDRRIIAELRQLGWDVECLDIGEGFPSPDEATRSAARSLLLEGAGRPADRAGRPGAGSPARRCGRTREQEPATRVGASSPRPGMGTVRRTRPTPCVAASGPPSPLVREVVVTSPATAKLVAADYGVPIGHITVARPGSDPAPRSRGSRSEMPHLLSVGVCRAPQRI